MNASRDEQQVRPADGSHQAADDHERNRVVVVSQDGMGVADPRGGEEGGNPADLVEHPGKVMRIASMIKQLLEEVKSAPLDQAGRTRLAEIHRRSISELEEGLAPELVDELERITLPFGDDAPSDSELRIAQAQLVGWLEGLFHGIQAALFAQQMAAQQQLQTMRRALPPGASDGADGAAGASGQSPHSGPGMPADPDSRGGASTGQYL